MEDNFRFIAFRSSRYLTLVENQPEFVFLADEDRQVISLPPLTNAERTEISLLLSLRRCNGISIFSFRFSWVRRVQRCWWRSVIEWWKCSSKRSFVTICSKRILKGNSIRFSSFNERERSIRMANWKWPFPPEQISSSSKTKPRQRWTFRSNDCFLPIKNIRKEKKRKGNSLRDLCSTVRFLYLFISDFRESNEFSSTTDVEFGISDRFNFVAQRSRTDRNAGRRNSSSDRIDPSASPPTTTAAAAVATEAGVAASLAERTARAGMNDDHLHQIMQFCKDNFTSTFPFALILILKGFYEHSAGQFTLNHRSSSLISLTCRNLHGDLLLGQYLSWKECFNSSSLVESKSHSFVDQRRRRLFSSSLVESW